MACITLSSDLGLHDPSTGIVKGILMQESGFAHSIIDLSHSLDATLYPTAAYLIGSAYRHFPPDTVHLVLYDIFADKDPRLVHLEHEGFHFLAPDNGILPLALHAETLTGTVIYAPEHPVQFQEWIRQCGGFIKSLSGKKKSVKKAEMIPLRTLQFSQIPTVPVAALECTVLHIDRFGNVVLNITRQQLEPVAAGRPFRIQAFRTENLSQLHDNLYEVGVGQSLCRFNSAGYLEVGVRYGNAAQLFGMELPRKKALHNRTIRIVFG